MSEFDIRQRVAEVLAMVKDLSGDDRLGTAETLLRATAIAAAEAGVQAELAGMRLTARMQAGKG